MVALLYSPTFHAKLALIWRKHYRSIDKTTEQLSLDVPDLMQLKMALQFEGVKALGGYEQMINLINELKINYNWSKSMQSRARIHLRSIMNNKYLVKKVTLVEELDFAIEHSNVVKNFINIL